MVSAMHKTIKKVTSDIENMKFNTAIAALMTLVNKMYEVGSVNHAEYKTLLTLLNPFAPHMTEELYHELFGSILSEGTWVSYDEALCVDATVEIVVQLNGKVKTKMVIPANLDREGMEKAAMENDEVKALLDGKTVVKVITVPGKLVNIVVK
jgi:leucyl-tRNA synthetase